MDIYNEEIKREYLNSASKGYENIGLNIFRTSNFLEKKYKKDLFEFDLEQMGELMSRLNPKSKFSSGVRFRYIFHYVNYYKHLREDSKNPLPKINTKWHEEFISSNRKLISEKELDEIIEKTFNPQDKAIFRLLFEGVNGKNNSEIINLKKQDISWENNIAQVRNEKSEIREVKLTDTCMTLLRNALHQTVYHENNGLGNQQALIDRDYIIKRVGRNSKDTEERSFHLIQRKIKILKKVSNNKDLTAKVLIYSGWAWKAIEVSKKYKTPIDNFIHSKHWKKVAEHFNLKVTKMNGYDYCAPIAKNLDISLMKELYGDYIEYSNEEFKLVDESNIIKGHFKRKRRIDSPKFRELTIAAYNKCAITGEKFLGILEACHIQPYINEKSNHIQNSILLRIDIHELFDSGLITIDGNYKVYVSSLLSSEYYQSFQGKTIHLPEDSNHHPSKKALEYNFLKNRA
ncbi:HNH endonuclease [Fictibacillus enclensis]|uniref:phage lytic cycle repressor MrpR family protein n=1 Tax=Fictibacillus enclensis TaxID=1017270 RepID=UPI0025A184F7|nr:HNH endonuclease [Fictibacillus enclensis]MDM5197591.1 HNH endonuclease [Fictibacillus enclensis]